jgi:type IV pilus assembly protein PilM
MASTGTGVVIGSHSVKVVQARKKGGILRITRVANRKLDAALAEHPLDARKADRLGSFLAESGAKAGEAMLGLTGRDLIIRYTHVPPVPDWRLGMLMKFEIEEVSEQSGGEVSADWASLDLPESSSPDKTVLVALAKNSALEPRIEVLRRGNLRLRGACPNAIAAYHAFVSTAHYEPGEVTLIMHIGAENTDIAIQKDGRLLFARNVAGGGGLFTEAIMSQFGAPYDRAERMKFQKVDVTPRATAQYADSLSEKVSNAVLGVTGQFVSMVHSSSMFCKAQTKLKELQVDRVVLTGGGANLRGFRAYLETNLGMPVVVYDPTQAVDLSGLPPDQQQEFEKDPTGLTVAVGLASMALERGAMSVEIMPEEYRKRRQFRERGIWMLAAGAVAAILMIILFVSSGRDQGALTEEESQLRDVRVTAQNRNEDLRRLLDVWDVTTAKMDALRNEVIAGPCLVKALAWTKDVILGEDFKEIHITKIQTERRDVTRPKRKWDPAEEDEDRGGRSGRKRTVPALTVEFDAAISELAGSPEEVFSRFGTRLGETLKRSEAELLRKELDHSAADLGLDEAGLETVRDAIRGAKVDEDEEEYVYGTIRRISRNLPTVWLEGPSPGRGGRDFKFTLVFAFLDTR